LRLFVAVDIPLSHQLWIDQAIQGLRSELRSARWLDRSHWHVTLKFLGEVPDDEVDGIRKEIARVVSGTGAVESQLKDLGAFPSLKRARVMWVGVADPRQALSGLASKLDLAFGQQEKRKFSPHLTLARIPGPAQIGEVVNKFRPFQLDSTPFEFEEVTLYRSRLSPPGARYEPLARFPL
jgi:RNA 2',3'-cyclic 3'-phosphodiesterase